MTPEERLAWAKQKPPKQAAEKRMAKWLAREGLKRDKQKGVDKGAP